MENSNLSVITHEHFAKADNAAGEQKNNIDAFVKRHQICFGWLSKNFDVQGVVVFQVRDYTYGMSSS